MTAYAERVEERIKADFEAHPGSWRGDPLNWYREGWLAGFTARSEDGEQIHNGAGDEERHSADHNDRVVDVHTPDDTPTGGHNG